MPIAPRLKHPGALLLLLLASHAAAAQSAHPISVGADYTYLRTNVLPGCNCIGLQGGSGQVEYAFGPHLAAVADATVSHRSGITPDGYSLTQLTYTFGVRYWPNQPHMRLRPFADLRVGGAHTSGSLSPDQNFNTSSNAFALETGGGLQLALSHRWTLEPIEAEYLLTTFYNNAANRQNDLKLSAGVLFRLSR